MGTRQLKLVSPIPVSINHYLAYRCVIKNGKPMAVSYCTKEAKEYRKMFAQYVTEQVQKQGWDNVPNATQHYYLDALFFFPRTDMDCQNYFKILTDSITDTQLIWLDDNVVCERVQGICYDAQNPRIELCIHPVDYIGIFANQCELDGFEARCETCSRYARNCSLLQKAKGGKIQDEISDGICTKYNKKGD